MLPDLSAEHKGGSSEVSCFRAFFVAGLNSSNLSGPISRDIAILSYHAMLLKGGLRSPKMVRYPPLVLSFTQAHLCGTTFCNISRDNCAIPPPQKKNKHERFLQSIVASIARYEKHRGPLRQQRPICEDIWFSFF